MMKFCKKILGPLMGVMVLASSFTMAVSADEPDYLLNYDANAVSGESGYVDLSKKANYGIKEDNTLVWSVVSESVFGRSTIRFSPRAAGTDSVTSYGKFVFGDDKANSPQPLNDTDATYMLEMEVSSILRNAKGAYYYTIMGEDDSSNSCEVLKLKTYGSGTEGYITADGVSGANAIPVHLSNSGNVNGGSGSPAGLYYIRTYIDLKAQTYSVWVVKRADGDNYTAELPAYRDLIVADAPMNTNVSKISAVDFSAVLNQGGDKVNLSFLRVSKAADETVLNEAAQELTDSVIKLNNSSLDKVFSDLNLPQAFIGTEVEWNFDENLSPYISADGSVTVPDKGEDAVTGEMSAVLTRGAAEPVTKTFTVTLLPGGEAGVITSVSGSGVNLAKGVSVSGTSEYNSSFGAAKVVDGSTTTRWATPSSENTKEESLTFDFGETTSIDCFNIDEFYDKGVRRTEKCRIEVSDDGEAWTECENTLTDKGTPATYHRKFILEVPETIQGRYFKISFIRSEACLENGVSVWEVEAYQYDAIEDIKAADESLNPSEWLGENSDTKSITTNLNLPGEVSGMAITWSSSDPEIIAADGTVNRPEGKNKNVLLTATFTSSPNKTHTCVHRFVFKVLADNEFKISVADKSNILSAILAGENADVVITVSDPAGETKTVNAYAAVYDENGVLIYVSMPVAETVSESKTLTGNVQLPQELAEKAKTAELFIWNEALTPYTMEN